MQFISANDYEKALPCLDRSVDAEPTNGSYHFWRGKCLSALDKSKEACAEFKLAAMLASDAKLKEDCRSELARYNLELPKGSVNEAGTSKHNAEEREAGAGDSETSNGEKLFRLSSKKLEWNLVMRNDFLQSMKARTDGLDGLARGNQWRVPAGVGMNRGVPVDLRAALQNGPAHFNIPLSAGERKALAQSDVAIILDHSGSMRAMDCPSVGGGVEARISWCAEEMENFAENLASAFPHGFHFITFDAKPEVYAINSATRLREVLHSLTSGGGTDLSAALNEAFRLHTAHPQQPLLIAVITDAEIDVHSCEQTIVNATRRFPLPNGVFITLLQIGIISEGETVDRVSFLDNLRARGGAAYDAYIGVPFSKVRREGLGRDLLIGLRTNVFSSAQAGAGTTSAPHSAAGVADGPKGLPASSTASGQAEGGNQSTTVQSRYKNDQKKEQEHAGKSKSQGSAPSAKTSGNQGKSASSKKTDGSEIPLMWPVDSK